MHPLTGYVDRWSVRPGERIRFMVSSAGDLSFDLRFVRHLCADPNPDGPGYREVAMPTPLDGAHHGRFQAARPGSRAEIARLALPAAPAGLRLDATIWPTRPGAGRQCLIAVDAPGVRVRLYLAKAGGIGVEVNDARAEVAAPMLARRWYDVTAAIDPAAGRLRVSQAPHRPLGRTQDGGAADGPCGPVGTGVGRVVLAAEPDGDGATSHYSGKLERPRLAALDGSPVAAWDLSVGIETQGIVDRGPQGAHGRLVNLPTRAMTGSSWTGEEHRWTAAPEQYGAIHFHDDDLGDCDWEESFALDVPGGWPSGFYAAHLRNEAGEDLIPFFVRPAPGAALAAVAVLVPTFTYQVYSCFVRPGRGAENRDRASAWGALLETPDMNPQFGLSAYNEHSDGSGVSITSMRRPQLDTRPRQMSLMDPAPGGSGTQRIGCDSYLIDWLDRTGVAHDVVTDHDLHAEGLAALAPYRVVIAAQHPEYYSARMLDGLDAYLARGGRLMYLGGNGFYWRAEPSAEAPHALEVRRAEGGIRIWATEPGESYHQFGGALGGLWRRIGRPAHRLVGNGFSAQGRHLGFPYRFTAAIRDPRVDFMIRGIEDVAVPDAVFGETGLMGGGAAGHELDSADLARGTPPHALVVAKGVVIHEDYRWVNEDMLTHLHPKPREEWSCADMVFFETAAGGAVFSAGSMTYAGSLPPQGYATTLARLTANVLHRFLDPTPFA